MPKKKKITVRFSKKMKSEMQACIINGGYGFHGKSLWVEEAINKFLESDGYIETANNGKSLNSSELSEVEAFYLSDNAFENLYEAIAKIRNADPYFEGVVSSIIRASVVHRLVKES